MPCDSLDRRKRELAKAAEKHEPPKNWRRAWREKSNKDGEECHRVCRARKKNHNESKRGDRGPKQERQTKSTFETVSPDHPRTKRPKLTKDKTSDRPK